MEKTFTPEDILEGVDEAHRERFRALYEKAPEGRPEGRESFEEANEAFYNFTHEDFRDGAEWALRLMSETLGQLRELLKEKSDFAEAVPVLLSEARQAHREQALVEAYQENPGLAAAAAASVAARYAGRQDDAKAGDGQDESEVF